MTTGLLDQPPCPAATAGLPRLLATDAVASAPPPALSALQLVDLTARAGLLGRGGAGFPTWRKLAAVAAARGRPVVVANGAEGEPASGKDAWLLTHRPELVLEGLALTADALRATETYLYVGPPHLVAPLQRRADTRHATGVDRRRVQVVAAPDTFLAGEETAAVGWLAGRPAVPRTKPPLVAERGLRGKPTLVQNVETLAQLALVARHGPEWFRQVGTADEPGSLLVTVSGGVHRPGVYETAHGAPLRDVLAMAGGVTGPLAAVLVGGYHGGWITAEEAARVSTSRPVLAALGASLGAGVIAALPASRCGVTETGRVLTYLSGHSARQCGPCLNGLPRLAALATDLAGRRADRSTVGELHRIAGLVDGRGACHHPDGSVGLLRSALRVCAGEVDAHLRGTCTSAAAAAPQEGTHR